MEGEGGGQVQMLSATVEVPTVCDIPMELWLDIIVPLESQDVLSLQSTCRYLRYILNTRDIWAMALRQMCKKRAVFIPSFPVNDMDLPRLKRASLSPYRFTKLLESNSHHSADLPSIIPEKSTKVDIGRPHECEQSFLVPGGRFLIVARQFAVDLWDFGPPDCPALQTPICLATRPAEPDLYPYPRPAESTTLMAVRMVREDTMRVAVAIGAIASVFNLYSQRQYL